MLSTTVSTWGRQFCPKYALELMICEQNVGRLLKGAAAAWALFVRNGRRRRDDVEFFCQNLREEEKVEFDARKFVSCQSFRPKKPRRCSVCGPLQWPVLRGSSLP